MHGRIALVLAAMMLFIPLATAQVGDSGPAGIHLAFGADASTEMTVSWLGPADATARVEYGIDEPDVNSVDGEPTTPIGSSQAAYVARITGLEPATTYLYRVVMTSGTSEEHAFTTAPEPGSRSEVTITAFADHGTVHPANTRADGDNPMRVLEQAAAMDPTFHLHAGDTSYAEGDPFQWNLYFDQIEPLASKAPYMAVPGNHEREGAQGFHQYDTRFHPPEAEDGRWWAFQHGDILVLGLASERACMSSPVSTATLNADEADDCETSEPVEAYPPQLEWFEQTLEAAADDPTIRWRIVLTHHLFWSSSVHAGARGLVEHYMPLMDEHGVDVVVQGHDHVYERTKLLADGELSETGILYLTNGAAGSGNYDWAGDEPDFTAARDNEHYGTLVLEINGDQLDGRFVALDGTVIDSFRAVSAEEGGVRMVDGNASADQGAAHEAPGESDDMPLPLAITVLALVGAVALRRRG